MFYRKISLPILAAFTAAFISVPLAGAATFTDVQPSDWFYNDVEQLASSGVLNISTGTFRPGDLVNRAEMAKLAVEAFKYPLENPDTPTFKDVPKTAWFYPYVETAVKNGIIGGYLDGTGMPTGNYGPADPLTREQAIKIVVMAAPLTLNTKSGPHFLDVINSRWSYQYIETAYNWSVISVNAEQKFYPDQKINRAETARIIANSINENIRY